MYSKNDYRYYLENQLMHSDDCLAHYGIKGMKWKKHKSLDSILDGTQRVVKSTTHPVLYDKNGMLRTGNKLSKQNASNENKKGVKRTSRTDVHGEQNFVNTKTKIKPNMYTTQRKAKYSKSELNSHYTLSSGGHTEEWESYGQAQKRADIRADKKMRRQAINAANPYKYDSDKSLKSNIKTNKAISNKRKRAKKKAYAQVDKEYRGV